MTKDTTAEYEWIERTYRQEVAEDEGKIERAYRNKVRLYSGQYDLARNLYPAGYEFGPGKRGRTMDGQDMAVPSHLRGD